MNKFISDLIYYHDLQVYDWLKNSAHWSFLNTESTKHPAMQLHYVLMLKIKHMSRNI